MTHVRVCALVLIAVLVAGCQPAEPVAVEVTAAPDVAAILGVSALTLMVLTEHISKTRSDVQTLQQLGEPGN